MKDLNCNKNVAVEDNESQADFFDELLAKYSEGYYAARNFLSEVRSRITDSSLSKKEALSLILNSYISKSDFLRKETEESAADDILIIASWFSRFNSVLNKIITDSGELTCHNSEKERSEIFDDLYNFRSQLTDTINQVYQKQLSLENERNAISNHWSPEEWSRVFENSGEHLAESALDFGVNATPKIVFFQESTSDDNIAVDLMGVDTISKQKIIAGDRHFKRCRLWKVEVDRGIFEWFSDKQLSNLTDELTDLWNERITCRELSYPEIVQIYKESYADDGDWFDNFSWYRKVGRNKPSE